MDPAAMVLTISCGTIATAYVLKVITDGVIRLQASRRPVVESADVALLNERLERLEGALETMAVELERVGEISRFSMQIAERQRTIDRMRTPLPVETPTRNSGKSITPH